MNMSDTYICAVCGETFDKGLTDAEAAEQFKREFPSSSQTVPLAETDLVCDDCYQEFSTWAKSVGYEKGK